MSTILQKNTWQSKKMGLYSVLKILNILINKVYFQENKMTVT